MNGIILAMTNVRIVGFAGSLRQGSFNKKLLAQSLEGARQAGAEVESLDLRDFEAPLYDADFEAAQGLPASVLAFKERIHAADGMLIATPENNASVSACLKNILDWASRPTSKEDPAPCFTEKTAAILSASPGRLGGIRCLGHLRAILMNLHVHIMTSQYALPGAHEAFAEDGTLLDAHAGKMAHQVGAELVRFTSLLKSSS